MNELHSLGLLGQIGYWRDKQKHEVDLLYARRGHPPLAIECKWSAGNGNLDGLEVFSRHYPQSTCLVVSSDVDEPYTRTYGQLKVKHVGISGMTKEVLALEK